MGDNFSFEIKLIAWSVTDSPPKPKTNAERIMFILILPQLTVEILLSPFVNSIIPVKNAWIILGFTLRKLAIKFEILNKNPVLFNIEIITENKTTKPPTLKILLMELITESDNIVPSSENEMSFLRYENLV